MLPHIWVQTVLMLTSTEMAKRLPMRYPVHWPSFLSSEELTGRRPKELCSPEALELLLGN